MMAQRSTSRAEMVEIEREFVVSGGKLRMGARY
jgi:hypothetical protein